MSEQLTAPFPYFGGKSRAADTVWRALGDVDSYVEPFGGSLALLLGRPDSHRRKIETVNDADGLLINWWRAVTSDPDLVARWADWPVSELDLTARHLWLVQRRGTITDRLAADPDWYDAQAAGWWVWGACSWIGSGWCTGEGPWNIGPDGVLCKGDDPGVSRQIPHLSSAGQGINRKLPHLGDAGRGVNAAGGGGVMDWFRQLSDRLRRVRITCGSWERVTTTLCVEWHGTAGIVLDPPYADGQDLLYAGQGDTSGVEISRQVFESAIDLAGRGVRVVVCGYDGTWTPPPGWTSRTWTARGGYGRNGNQKRERLWCSPACLPEREGTINLFGGR